MEKLDGLKYHQIVNNNFKELLEAHGYKKIKSTTFGRIVNDDIFQYIHFQAPMKGLKLFFVSFNVNLLFVKKPDYYSLAYNLGHRINFFGSIFNERLLQYNSDFLLDNSVKLIKQALENYVFEWLNNHDNLISVVNTYKNEDDAILRQPDTEWADITLAYINLKLGNKDIAIEIAKRILYNPPFHQVKIPILEDILSHQNDNDQQIKKYLNDIVAENKKMLKFGKL